MSKRFFAAAFVTGLAAVLAVGATFIGNNALALAMTAVIAGVYLLGAHELRHYRTASVGLSAALENIPRPLASLSEWLDTVPATLRNAVRLRVEGERVGLPGPALTPYLVGLLVMLGMLGTFLGMVVTFKGAVFALEGSTDLQAMRAALAGPIKGLALSFGTSVAGVAASAMLGLMSAIARRERLELARQLEGRIATTLLPFSLVHQRQETFKAIQAQSHALPEVVDKLQALMERIEQRSQQLDDQLLAGQAGFHREATAAYTGLARSVGTALNDSLQAGARAAGDSIRPVVEGAMARIVQEAAQLHERLGHSFEQRSGALLAQLREESTRLAERDNIALQERTALLAQLDTLLNAVNQTNGEQRAAIASMVASSTAAMQQAGDTFAQALETQAAKTADTAAHVTASAVELAALGEAFGLGVQGFQASNDKLTESLNRIAQSLNQSTARSDEQLAYYVAQAREVIDLSIASQAGVIDSLRQLQGKPAKPLAVVAAGGGRA
jgi:hypothetical protein